MSIALSHACTPPGNYKSQSFGKKMYTQQLLCVWGSAPCLVHLSVKKADKNICPQGDYILLQEVEDRK